MDATGRAGGHRNRGLEAESVHTDGERGLPRVLREGQADLATAFLSGALIAAVSRATPEGMGGERVGDSGTTGAHSTPSSRPCFRTRVWAV